MMAIVRYAVEPLKGKCAEISLSSHKEVWDSNPTRGMSDFSLSIPLPLHVFSVEIWCPLVGYLNTPPCRTAQ